MKVFLGGTCNESKWRDKLIPMLDIDYFNPVVEDWDEKAQEREINERKTCDYCLYVITPRMTSVYSIAEVIDDSNKRPGRTIFCYLGVDEGEKFTDGQCKHLCMVEDMVALNGGTVCSDLEDIARFFKELT